ncbi:bifunctional (p)ppGpp synthetase/guanosine-3',5'-bis(diphosphate) 3'-pyrophosphohydrolase [Seleniivibrio sp.]|uniref:RelA/SpoT family protein n=1 Tax=Seleniivibrio sp. TaxID=2898801 RepID=UPI0025FC1100|nr:bifunctional (p)ppGpp synthetase/guanosine-3',5'-bis(diphosphate) 3'-pyrophosphohydrolase [Seleniivibrio sp.]MCD8553395.1 bifunctional (p)ppGpp synthetase/guanosine-3',5'-bis(diphosphate) 3'-pyrophosphohydrolase [Seleniivibrio sp.]
MATNRVIRLMDIQDMLTANGIAEGFDRVHKAYIYAAQKHRGQLRKSGEPYLSHPLNVAYILAQMNMDVDTVIGGLLHDTIEDTDATFEEISELFGQDVAFIVEGVSKIGKIIFKSAEEKQAENFRKMLISMSKDVRVIIIKLADRLHNMRTLDYLAEEKKQRIARETMDIYAPMAHRLGIAWIKWELEDMCFRILNPDAYYDIYEKVKLKRGEREQYLAEIKETVVVELEKHHIKAVVSGRPKHFYSIYNKMIKKKVSFEEIYDLLALRVLVEDIPSCYAAMGIMHNMWKPIQHRFKDYIAMPKANLYQSLHTTIIGPKGITVEFQIRTQEMHSIAEKGIAAHWKYKEGRPFDPQEDKAFKWLRQLLEQHELHSPEDLVEALKEDVLPTQIYVFTPKGDVMELPVGSTPVDFAYNIHTDVGNKCKGAKVDGRIVPLKYKLRNGDRVSIILGEDHKPSRDWLNFVKTSKAKNRIRAALRKIDTDMGHTVGFDLLDKEFTNAGLDVREIFNKPDNIRKIIERFKLRDEEEIFLSVGFGRVSPKQVVHVFSEPASPQRLEDIQKTPPKDAPRKTSTPFIIEGIDDVMVKIAKCCTPLPGDDVVGYISRGRGIVVHRVDCTNLKNTAFSDERLVDVQWDSRKSYKMPVRIHTSIVDKPGVLSALTTVLKEMGLNILELSSKRDKDGLSSQDFSIEVRNKSELESVIRKIKTIDGLREVNTAN